MAQTRRQMIGGMAGILAAGVAPGAVTWCSSVGVEKDGGHNLPVDLVAIPGKQTSKGYVKDGLLYHLDGIDNDGYGQHSATISFPIDLTGRIQPNAITFVGTAPTIDEIGVYFARNSFAHFDDANIIATATATNPLITIECVFSVVDYLSGPYAARCKDSFNRVIGGYSSTSAATTYYNYNGSYITIPAAQSHHQTGTLGQSSFVGNGTAYSFNENGVLTISGNRSRGSSFGTGDDFNIGRSYAAGGVKVSALRVYNRVLTDDERKANWDLDKARFNL